MEVKKSPKADLENKRTMFTLIGLVLALGFAYICFEWTNTEAKIVTLEEEDWSNEGEEEIQSTTQIEPPVQIEQPPVQQQQQTQINIVEDDQETDTHIEVADQDNDTPIEIPTAPVQQDDEEEGDDVIFTVVENKAEFPGGQAKLMDFLKKELVYPPLAIENGTQGRVFVEFIVNKNGSIQDVRVSRSSGDKSLDEEAIRVVKKMPAWKPAKQQGRDVRSKFTLPVNFKLK